MKTKTNKLYLIVCAVLALALLLSLIGFISARSNVKELKADVLALTEENQQLKLINQTLQNQLGGIEEGEAYCELVVSDWSEKNGKLTVSTSSQVFLPSGANASARLELWHGPNVIGTETLTLTLGATGSYDADVSATFNIPALQADEELQLWLVVESDITNTFSSCGAGWYLEGNQLMIIAG